ncbi:MAG: pyridoxal phosphate-dependent aminotransferase [Bdellovibrionaceae bacterium]|nr:pyridoxal phosphate-dependent aminotransferase [Bdellovibrionales bacterium]MCB9084831.1 pyridoxal phosphate-dependent aminotransferase [Pseudobdellovibrionaceae bacterium]
MLADRVASLKPSPTLALAAKAKELKKQGHDVYSLTVGEPDWDTFEQIKAAGIEAIKSGQTKYAPANGLPELRQAICEQTILDLGHHYDADQVTVSTGAKFVLYAALQALVNPGDEVIVPGPYWVSYPTMVELAAGKPVLVNCGPETGFKLTAELLERHITPKTKLIILNSPSNPTGSVYTMEEWKQIGEVLKKHKQVVVLSDDIYNRLIFDGSDVAPHILQTTPELVDRTVVVNGVSKTYSMTGWRLGWAVGPKEVIKAMTNLQSQSVSCASPFTQIAALAALKMGKDALAPYLKKLQVRRDFVYDSLSKMKGVKVLKPQGAFYIFPDFRGVCGRGFKGHGLDDCSQIAKVLLEEELVATVPGCEFGAPGFLRLSFALDQDVLGKALMRIESFIDRLD